MFEKLKLRSSTSTTFILYLYPTYQKNCMYICIHDKGLNGKLTKTFDVPACFKKLNHGGQTWLIIYCPFAKPFSMFTLTMKWDFCRSLLLSSFYINSLKYDHHYLSFSSVNQLSSIMCSNLKNKKLKQNETCDIFKFENKLLRLKHG